MDKTFNTNITVRKTIFPFKQYHSTLNPYLELSDYQKRFVREFNRKVESGDIDFESVSCLCGNADFDLISSVDAYSMLQKTVLCTRCGLIQSNPRMTESEFKNFYSSDFYRNCYESDDYLSIAKNKYTGKTGEHIFDELMKVKAIGPGISVLEIGAGGGWNLLPFIKAGAEATGVEYSRSMVFLGRERGINMVEGGLDRIEGVFDIIIINHVLEHFLNPVEALKKIAGHVRKEGLIYIAVPNILNFSFADIQNAHTYYFDPKSFIYYCSLAGLKNVAFGIAQDIHMFGIYAIVEDLTPQGQLNNHYKEIHGYLVKIKYKSYIKVVLAKLRLYSFLKWFREYFRKIKNEY